MKKVLQIEGQFCAWATRLQALCDIVFETLRVKEVLTTFKNSGSEVRCGRHD